MPTQAAVAGNDVIPNHPLIPLEFSARAREAVQAGASQMVKSTERTVRKYPLASLGLAVGGGVALAALGFILFSRPDER
jgi:hypothetical protein